MQRADLLADGVEDVRAQLAVVAGDDRGAEFRDHGHAAASIGSGAGARAAPAPRRGSDLPRVELERLLADPDLVAGLEAGRAKGCDHAHVDEALLEVGERLVVGEVVALDQQLDSAAVDAEGASRLLGSTA